MSKAISGIGVVFDDQIHKVDKSDRIGAIIADLESEDIPILKFDYRPEVDLLRNLTDVCFIILDWKFNNLGELLEVDGVTLGSELEKSESDKNIEFIHALRENCFAPIFIFSDESPTEIKQSLKDEKLLQEDENRGLIYVRSKSELRSESGEGSSNVVAEIIIDWMNKNPAIHLFENWKTSQSRSQTKLFWELYHCAPSWPKILWAAFNIDEVDPNFAITELMQRNIRARLPTVDLDEALLSSGSDAEDQDTLRKLFEFSILIPDSSLAVDEFGTGDIFHKENNDLLLNIRCDCDTVLRGSRTEDNTRLYCLEGTLIKEKSLKKRFDARFGLQHGKASEHTIFPISGKGAIVHFDELHPKTISEVKEEGWTRIGRLTPPIITQIRQRFSMWLQREGVARIPVEAVFLEVELPDESANID